MATTYNVATESAEKLALRLNSKGGASVELERGVYLLKSPLSATITTGAGGSNFVTGTYQYYVTRVSNGVESFGQSGVFALSASVASLTWTVSDISNNQLEPSFGSTYNIYLIKSTDANWVANSVTPTAVGASLPANIITAQVSQPFAYKITPTPIASNTPISTTTPYAYSAPVAIATGAITANGTTWSVTTSTTQNYVAGESVTLTGLVPSAYNGTYTIAGITTPGTVFTIANGTSPGAVTVAGTVSATQYQNSPAVIGYPLSAGQSSYNYPNWTDDVVVHNPNPTTGYSGYPVVGQTTQVRQVQTRIIESQLYTRTDTAVTTNIFATTAISYSGGVITVTATGQTAANLPVGTVVTIAGASVAAYNNTWVVATTGAGSFTINATLSGSPGAATTSTVASGFVVDSNVTWFDFGKIVGLAAGTAGLPTNAYVGTVIPGSGFQLSSVQGQQVPYFPATQASVAPSGFVVTAALSGTSLTLTGSNVGPLPVQTSQYRTTRWQG